jgi:hypothetical protein
MKNNNIHFSLASVKILHTDFAGFVTETQVD